MAGIEQGRNKRADKSLYDPKFVLKILKGSKEVAEGKGTKIALKDIWK